MRGTNKMGAYKKTDSNSCLTQLYPSLKLFDNTIGTEARYQYKLF